VWRAAAVAVPLNARMREYDLARVLDDAQTSVLVTVPEHAGYSFAELLPDLLRELPCLEACMLIDDEGAVREELRGDAEATSPEPLPAEVAAILYTSGTTGDPKGVLVRHSMGLHAARELAGLLRLGPEDASVLVVPIPHAFGLACFVAAIGSGGTAVLVDSSFTLEPLLDAVARRGATILHGSPALFGGLLRARPDGLPGVRGGFVAGAPSPPELLEALERAGLTILNLYGMTELGAASSCRLDDPPEVRMHSAGRALREFEFRIAPRAGADTDIGEIQVRGPHVTPGYFRRPEATAEAFDGDWFRTGDLGSLDEAGNLRISGREKELVLVAGFNVFPAEVESFLLTHPEVLGAAVVGVPDERLGEALRAFVVVRPGSGLTPQELLRWGRGRIASYKLPRSIELVAELPLLASGKPDKRALLGGAAEVGVAHP
jgi:acyl-CoA synthetase (AMP-forming)/AMP-acid ligase II